MPPTGEQFEIVAGPARAVVTEVLTEDQNFDQAMLDQLGVDPGVLSDVHRARFGSVPRVLARTS